MTGLERIAKQVAETPVVIYMKGSPQLPSCGFSSRASQALAACEQEFSYVNIIEDMEIYEALPRSEERRVGKEVSAMCISRVSPTE